MDNLKHKEIFFNRAEVENGEEIYCDNCFEQVVFFLKDNEHEFSMGLSTVLECLLFAVRNGDLPKLPSSWISNVSRVYNIDTSDDAESDITYYDEDYYRKRDTNEVFQSKSKQNGGKV